MKTLGFISVLAVISSALYEIQSQSILKAETSLLAEQQFTSEGFESVSSRLEFGESNNEITFGNDESSSYYEDSGEETTYLQIEQDFPTIDPTTIVIPSIEYESVSGEYTEDESETEFLQIEQDFPTIDSITIVLPSIEYESVSGEYTENESEIEFLQIEQDFPTIDSITIVIPSIEYESVSGENTENSSENNTFIQELSFIEIFQMSIPGIDINFLALEDRIENA